MRKLLWIWKAGNVRAADSTDVDVVEAFNSMLLFIGELLPFGRFWAVRSLFRSILSWLLRRLAGTDYVRSIKSRSEITSSQPQKELLPLADTAQRCPSDRIYVISA